ncbi:MAG: NAD(+)/NADH kinase [Ignavibacteriae bacterium]|nr:NAD(+)/NADH kinase [Ignavibacteriota bacterium]
MRFGIIGNINKPDIESTLFDLLSFMTKEKLEFFLDKDLISKITKPEFKKRCFTSSEVVRNSDVIISLGGDGTFLHTARLVGNKQIPIFGVNMGTLGFMSEVNPSEMKKFIKQVSKKRFKVKDRVVLSCKLPDGKKLYGINEIVVDRSYSIRMMEIEILYNDEKVVRFLGDGVIISTPTGCTGYSLSAGGPIVSLESSDFIITPICPHTLNVRPIIVPDKGIITVKVHREIDVRVTADGQNFKNIKSPIEFTFEKADYTMKVINRPRSSYFKTLNKKLLWGKDLRKY